MSFLDNDSLYGWIIPYAKRDDLSYDELIMLQDSVGYGMHDVFNWYKHKYGTQIIQGGKIIEYNEYLIAEARTDSMGYYVFENVPVGIYQIRCAFWPVIKEISDTEPHVTAVDLSDVDWDTMPTKSIKDDRIPIFEESCINGVTNFIRVPPDSTAIVKVEMSWTSDGMAQSIPYYWEEQYKIDSK